MKKIDQTETLDSYHTWLKEKHMISFKYPGYWMCKKDHYILLEQIMLVGYIIEYFQEVKIEWTPLLSNKKLDINYENLKSLLYN